MYIIYIHLFWPWLLPFTVCCWTTRLFTWYCMFWETDEWRGYTNGSNIDNRSCFRSIQRWLKGNFLNSVCQRASCLSMCLAKRKVIFYFQSQTPSTFIREHASPFTMNDTGYYWAENFLCTGSAYGSLAWSLLLCPCYGLYSSFKSYTVV